MDDVELDNERHKREEQERRAKRKVSLINQFNWAHIITAK